jgi:murein L,D-transpeptidase YafK
MFDFKIFYLKVIFTKDNFHVFFKFKKNLEKNDFESEVTFLKDDFHKKNRLSQRRFLNQSIFQINLKRGMFSPPKKKKKKKKHFLSLTTLLSTSILHPTFTLCLKNKIKIKKTLTLFSLRQKSILLPFSFN